MNHILQMLWAAHRAKERFTREVTLPRVLAIVFGLLVAAPAVAKLFSFESLYNSVLAYGLCIFVEDCLKNRNLPPEARVWFGPGVMFTAFVVVLPFAMCSWAFVVLWTLDIMPAELASGALSFPGSVALFYPASLVLGVLLALPACELLLELLTRLLGPAKSTTDDAADEPPAPPTSN